jgi:hypothetical protein
MEHISMSSVIEKLKPLTSEEYVSINDSFWAHYACFKNEVVFERPANYWKHWAEKSFIPPTSNYYLSDPYSKGVEFGCYEHVSICVNGDADYILTNGEETFTYNWAFGAHNVENGWGYLPKGEFTRVFNNDFVLCCILFKNEKNRDITYNFEVIQTVSTPFAVERDYSFAFVAAGQATYDGVQYSAKQSIQPVLAGNTLALADDTVVILGFEV